MRTYQHTRRIYPQPARVSILSLLPRLLVISAFFLVVFYAGWAFRELRQHIERKANATSIEPVVRVVVKPVKPEIQAATGTSSDTPKNIERQDASITARTTNVTETTAQKAGASPAVAKAAAATYKPDANQSGSAGRELLPFTVNGRIGRSSGAQLTRPSPGGTLFSWGLREWRLARMAGDTSVPEPAQRHMTVISIAASRHSAIANTDGVVWTMGHNDSKGGGGHGSPPLQASGQLGRSGSREPGPVEGALRGKFVVQVATGRYHTMAVTEDGELYSWGLNDWGQLGRRAVGATSESDPAPCTAGASCHSGCPELVAMPSGVRVVGAASGRYMSMAVDEAGRLYTWGLDGCSNGGKLPERNEAYKPRLVSGELASKRVVAFDAGYVFWLAATAEGEVYTCNSQDDGYAGTLSNKREPNNAGELGRDGDPFLPGKVAGVLKDKKVEVVAAGREHAIVASASGEVFTWGGRELLIGRDGDYRVPGQALGALQGDKILHVAAGEYHSGAASETTVYGWGSNNYVCTGLGKDARLQLKRPAKALGPIADGGWHVQALAAGYQHALAIAANKGGSWESKARPSSSPSPAAASAAVESSNTADKPATKDEPAERNQQKQEQQQQQQQEKPSDTSSRTTATAQFAPSINGSANADVNVAGQGDVMAFDMMPYTDTSAPFYHTRYLEPQLQPRRYNASIYFHRFRHTDRIKLVQAEAPDVFEVLPHFYHIQYKNPCWYDQSRRFRCLPYFHILGVSKCGTTDLYHRLSKHPHLFKSRNKGPHWWDECPYPPKGACTAPPNGDFDGYVDLFADAAAKIKANPQGITGEASSNTFTATAGVLLRGPSMDRNTTVTIAELMREAIPFLNSIIIFRNPVDRYYSAYYYYRRGVKTTPPPSPEDFQQVAKQEIGAWKACAEEFGVKHCVRKYEPQQLIKGMYAVFMMDWLNQFPRDQLLFLRNEDYSAKPREHMEAVFKFLEMREPTAAEWEAIMGMETRNKQSDKYKPMLPETRILLERFYQPFNERLAHTMEDDRWLWRDPPLSRTRSA